MSILITFYYGNLKLLPDQNITPSSAPLNFLNPLLNYLGTKARVRFNGSCLKLDKLHTLTEKIVNTYIVYEVNKNDNTSSDPTLEHFLFDAVSLTKNANIDR